MELCLAGPGHWASLAMPRVTRLFLEPREESVEGSGLDTQGSRSERGAHAGPWVSPPSPTQGHRLCLYPQPPKRRACSPPPLPPKCFLGFLRGPAAGLFWRPLHTLVPKSTPSALEEAALCQQATGGVKAATVAGGWPGRPSWWLVMRIPHGGPCSPSSLPPTPTFPPPDRPRAGRGRRREEDLRGRGQPCNQLQGPGLFPRAPEACPGGSSRWRTSGSRAGGKQTLRPVLSHRANAGRPEARPAPDTRRAGAKTH